MVDDKPAPANGESHKIQFPCAYPIKVVGSAAPDFREYVVEVMVRHAGELLAEVDVKPSSNGRFESVRVTINATGVEQLQAIFEELKASGRVHIVI